MTTKIKGIGVLKKGCEQEMEEANTCETMGFKVSIRKKAIGIK